MNFQQLKQNSQSQIDAISQALNQTQLKKESYGDDRIWKCERDKSGNGYLLVRYKNLDQLDAIIELFNK